MQSSPKLTRRSSGKGIISSAAVLAGAICGVIGASQNASASTSVVFDDTFTNGSTVDAVNYNTAATATSNSANYNVASSKTGTGTISGGTLAFTNSSTGSGISEVQAVFATGSSVVTLSPGQQIDLIVTFTSSGVQTSTGINTSGQIDFGLYNSSDSGLSPYNNLVVTGLTSTQTGDATGGVASWVGYTGQTYAPSNVATGSIGARILARLAQVPGSATNTTQEVLVPGSSSSSSSSNPSALNVGGSSVTGGAELTGGSTYTEDLSILLNSAGVETITSALYTGSAVIAGNLISTTGAQSTATNTSFDTSTFDSLAVGYRETSAAGSTEGLTLSQVEVTLTSVPEPASLGLIALGGLPLLWRRRKRLD
jgi:hypothetical protein